MKVPLPFLTFLFLFITFKSSRNLFGHSRQIIASHIQKLPHLFTTKIQENISKSLQACFPILLIIMRQSEIIFMDQLLHHRSVASQIQVTRSTWQKRSSWFPSAQREQYSQISRVYDDCLNKYGTESFEYYAKRIRLRKEFTENARSTIQKKERKAETSMEHLKGYKVPRTSNGEYGSVRPSKQFFCSNREIYF